MELPRRPKGDEYTRPGRYRELESQLRRRVKRRDIPVLYMYAFDYRTRLGPYLFVDKALIPGAPRSVGAALHAAGFENLRLVLQQWTPHVRPSTARIDGKRPELLMVSSMSIHAAAARELIRDAWQLGDGRPLIVAGGPKAIYEPWDYFALTPDNHAEADVVVTGEEFVMLELLDRITEHQGQHETMRQAFNRIRLEGLLEDIPGLVYRSDDFDGPPESLLHTGIQRLLQNLDELPMPYDAFGLFEPRHRRRTLAQRSVPTHQLYRHGSALAAITTHGCKFRCDYCPIPAYNQYTFRYQDPQRLVEELSGTAERTGIKFFFGTDDNFFNSRDTVEEIFSAMSKGTIGGKPFRDALFFATEGTEFDVYKQQDLLPLARDGGLRAIWFGIEDMTAELVKKGQSPEKTKEVFKLLLNQGIAPMPMMMHHDGQPLWSRGNLYGILNQVHYLWKAGAVSCQVTSLMPAVGTKSYDQLYRDGLVMSRVAGKPIEEYQFDGNHCIASSHGQAWRRQLNVLASYVYFYNPIRMLQSAFKFDSLWRYRMMYQLFGNLGVIKSAYQVSTWIRQLMTGPIEKAREVPSPRVPLIVPSSVDTGLVHYGLGESLPILDGTAQQCGRSQPVVASAELRI